MRIQVERFRPRGLVRLVVGHKTVVRWIFYGNGAVTTWHRPGALAIKQG